MNEIFARTPSQVRDQVLADTIQGSRMEITKGVRGAVVGRLNKYLGGDDNRQTVLAWLFSPSKMKLSSKKLTDAEVYGLYKWIGFYQDEDGWHDSPTFPAECVLVLTEAIKQFANTPPKKKNPELEVGEFLEQTIGFLGGVVTTITDEDGNPVVEGRQPIPPDYGKKDDLVPKKLDRPNVKF